LPELSREEVSRHNKEGDYWIIINGIVVNVSKFIMYHPGGIRVLERRAGTDASNDFNAFHKKGTFERFMHLAIAKLARTKTQTPPTKQHDIL
jgi:cytochrome b involved in lipid metabolism